MSNNKISFEKFKELANKKHDSKFTYIKLSYTNLSGNVIIICPTHGEFEQSASHHLNSKGCQKCNNPIYDLQTFIDVANKKHDFKYDYSKVIFINKSTNVIIICKKHGDFSQQPKCHLLYFGCHKCRKEIPSKLKFDTNKFIELSRKVHGNKYDYSKAIYVDYHTKLTIICDEHGEFSQNPDHHISGQGCKSCWFKKNSKKLTKTNEEFIEDVKRIFGDKYSFEKTNYVNDNTDVIITCKNHGDFTQKPHYLMDKSGCRKCSNKYSRDKNTFIEQANVKHNFKYNYSKIIYENSKSEIEIICPKHGSFFIQANRHLRGKSCKECNPNKSTISGKEIEWINSLNIKNLKTQFKIKIPGRHKLIADAYDENTNTVYEFHGDYFHGNPSIFKPNEYNKLLKKTFGELYNFTIKREKDLKTAGYNVVSIWENDWNNRNK